MRSKLGGGAAKAALTADTKPRVNFEADGSFGPADTSDWRMCQPFRECDTTDGRGAINAVNRTTGIDDTSAALPLAPERAGFTLRLSLPIVADRGRIDFAVERLISTSVQVR
jgi:hypothetical protein